jgi:hypothetical protein
MTMTFQMLHSARRLVDQRRFDWAARGVLETPPIEPQDGPLVTVSMVCHRDLLMYLLAIKTFYRRLGFGRIVVIDDGSLTAADKDVIRHHVQPAEIVPAKSLTSPACPSYISWKKLFCIVNFIEDSFVIQLDSDTLSVSTDLSEVRDHVLADTSFILGTWANQSVVSMPEAVRAARESSSTHVQMVAEQNFDRLPGFESLKYFRGCSGFDGFSKGLFTLKDLEDFSRRMYSIIGDKWGEWGSEQTMSNVLVANAPRMGLLPYPAYYNYWGTEEAEQKFIHFVGTYRYHGGVYLRAVRAALAELRGNIPLEARRRSRA